MQIQALQKTLLKLIQDFTPIFLALFIAISLGRMYEWWLLVYNHGAEIIDLSYLTNALFNDLTFAILYAVPLWLVVICLRYVFPSLQQLVILITIVTFGLLNFLLVIYFGDTLTPLGPEFWAYSLSEMSHTVVAAGGVSVWHLISFILVTYVLYVFVKHVLTKTELLFPGNRILLILAVFCLAVAGTLSLSYLDNTLPPDSAANKLNYFISSSLSSGNVFGSESHDYEINEEYPFLHLASTEDVLSPYFKEIPVKPNIVFLIIESLGGEFVGSNGQWSGFAPFIDSLTRKGLYWENGLSLSGRTFGMMPSLFGSLPPGRNGFMSVGPNYPDHMTLISLLKNQGYHTSFFSGFDTYFDDLDYFLDYQGLDFKLNKDKIQELNASGIFESGKNYWGYDDKSMLRTASSVLDTTKNFPRLDIYHTVQSHSPFTVPQPDIYADKFDNLLNEMEITADQKNSFRRYRSELTTLLYTDNALREFMEAYQKRDHYENTIFIITGDHWLIPVPQTSRISRYHVPIIFYSPLIRKPVHFESVNTHAEIVPSLTSFLKHSAGLSMPDQVHWIGALMDTTRSFRNIHSISLMQNKNQLSDYLDYSYYLSGDHLFKLQKGLTLVAVNNAEKKAELSEKLNQFKAKNEYVTQNNKLYAGSLGNKMPDKYKFIADYDTLFSRIDSLGLSVDEQFLLARQYAFNNQYEISRVIAERLLIGNADYHDIRLLLGRTYAWEGLYDQARERFHETIRRSPEYYDSYHALFDTEFWDSNYETALEVIKEGLKFYPDDEHFLEKKNRIQTELKLNSEAKQS